MKYGKNARAGVRRQLALERLESRSLCAIVPPHDLFLGPIGDRDRFATTPTDAAEDWIDIQCLFAGTNAPGPSAEVPDSTGEMPARPSATDQGYPPQTNDDGTTAGLMSTDPAPSAAPEPDTEPGDGGPECADPDSSSGSGKFADLILSDDNPGSVVPGSGLEILAGLDDAERWGAPIDLSWVFKSPWETTRVRAEQPEPLRIALKDAASESVAAINGWSTGKRALDVAVPLVVTPALDLNRLVDRGSELDWINTAEERSLETAFSPAAFVMASREPDGRSVGAGGASAWDSASRSMDDLRNRSLPTLLRCRSESVSVTWLVGVSPTANANPASDASSDSTTEAQNRLLELVRQANRNRRLPAGPQD